MGLSLTISSKPISYKLRRDRKCCEGNLPHIDFICQFLAITQT